MCENPLITAQLVSFLYLENRLSRVKTLIFLIKFLATSFKCFNGFWWFQRFLNLTRIFLKPFEVFSRIFFFACVSEFFDFKDHKTRFLHGNLDFSKIVFSKYCLHIYCVSNLFQFPVTSSYNSAIGKIAPSYYIYIYLF